MKNRNLIFIIVFAEFAGTSLWFGSNAVIGPLSEDLGISVGSYGYITSAVQLGFIIGTLAYAVLGLADRFSPSVVFFWSSIAAAASNVMISIVARNLESLLLLKLVTGFFLAGIYPVGMKIAADWFAKDLGKALGFLVGALVLGTAFPYLLSSTLTVLPWQYVLYATSVLACVGALMILLFVKDGPYRQKNNKFSVKGLWEQVKNEKLVRGAVAYFGHMWELYAFWTFVPIIISAYGIESAYVVSLLSFVVIAVGALSCVAGGYLVMRYGSEKVAYYTMFISAVCCVLCPLFFSANVFVFMLFLIIWGMAVVADSPQLSTIVAKHASKANLGSTLTIVNCIGFSVTILSIQLLNSMRESLDAKYLFVILALGPILGIFLLRKLLGNTNQ